MVQRGSTSAVILNCDEEYTKKRDRIGKCYNEETEGLMNLLSHRREMRQ